jgi:hypothetical protein
MKFSISIKAYYIVILLAVLLGIIIGMATVLRYEIVVRGLLGAATIYIVQLLFSPPKIFTSRARPTRMGFYESLQYFVAGLLLSIVVSWSTYYTMSTVIRFAEQIKRSLSI